MHDQIIGRTIARIMIPFIQLYGLYVITHGEGGPGGGFQGGVILGASIILYALIYDVDAGRRCFSLEAGDRLASLGVFIFSGIGMLCLLAGGNYLEYGKLPIGHPAEASHLGIMGIEIGVGITVAAVMITLFFETAESDDK